MPEEKIPNYKILQAIESLLDLVLNEIEKNKYDPKEKARIIRATLEEAFKDAGIECPSIPDEVLELRDILGKESDRGCVLSS